MSRALVLAVALLALAGSAGAQTSSMVTPSQPPTGTSNVESTSAANTAVAVTIAAQEGKRARLYGVTARCSAGTAAITITDGGTQVWSTSSGFITTVTTSISWPVPLTGGFNAALVVTLGTCGGGNTGTVAVQADRF